MSVQKPSVAKEEDEPFATLSSNQGIAQALFPTGGGRLRSKEAQEKPKHFLTWGKRRGYQSNSRDLV